MAGSQTICFTPVLGKRLRVIALDKCGNLPATGTANTVVQTSGFITAKMTAQIEAGADIITKKADGSLCVNQKVPDSLKRFQVDLEFCGVDPGLLSLVSNIVALQDYNSNYSGIGIPEGQIKNRFSLELWTGLTGSCPPGVAEASGYLLLPQVNGGVIGDIEVSGDKSVSFMINGAYTIGGNNWGVGPYSVLANQSGVASKLPAPLDPMEHMVLFQTGIAPPASACGLQPFLPV